MAKPRVSIVYLPGLRAQLNSDAILRDRLRRSGLMGATGGPALPTLNGLVPTPHEAAQAVLNEECTSAARRLLDPDSVKPSSVDLVRWLVDALRDRRNEGQRVRRLVMNAESYVDLVYGDRRFVPVDTVDAMMFSGLPISINETFASREVGFYG